MRYYNKKQETNKSGIIDLPCVVKSTTILKKRFCEVQARSSMSSTPQD